MMNKKEEIVERIKKFVEKLSSMKVDGSTFEEQFFIEGHSLWWIYKLRFIHEGLYIYIKRFLK